MWQRRTKGCADFCWHGTPNGLVSQLREIVEYIIDHAMPEGAQVCPIIWVEGHKIIPIRQVCGMGLNKRFPNLW
jgi:hypothetical protein